MKAKSRTPKADETRLIPGAGLTEAAAYAKARRHFNALYSLCQNRPEFKEAVNLAKRDAAQAYGFAPYRAYFISRTDRLSYSPFTEGKPRKK